jgi:hypothetical protein
MTTLLMMAVLQDQAKLALAPRAGQRFADEVIGNLPGLAEDHRLLASLRDELPLLAEAAPNPLLAALERMLEGDAKAIRPLFNESKGLLSVRANYTGLLFALETLAWDPDYFNRSALILARLADIDPGGNLGNRPIRSLGEIFLLWNPNTNAPATQRLAALDSIIKSLPNVGWSLICKLLPSNHGTSSPTPRPRFRDAGASERAEVTYAELWQGQADVVNRAIDLAADDSFRWQTLVPRISDFPPALRERAFKAIEDLLGGLSGERRTGLWEGLRHEAARHRRFAAAQWSLPEEDLIKLEYLVGLYAPADPITSVVWLVDTWEIDRLENRASVDEQRRGAIRNLFEKQGLDGIWRLGEATRASYLVVQALEQFGIADADLKSMLCRSVVANPDSFFARFISGLLLQRVGIGPLVEWLKERMISDIWSPETLSQLLFSWPDEQSTWDAAREIGIEVSRAYWRLKPVGFIDGSPRELRQAVLSLMRARRSDAAIKAGFNRLGDLPTKLLCWLLKRLLAEINTNAMQIDSMTNFYVEKIFEEIDQRKDVSDSAVAGLEFSYFFMIEHAHRPLRIYRVLAHDPDFYHQILCKVFRGEHEAPAGDVDSDSKGRWRIFYSLLSNFSTLPGTDGQKLDEAALSAWIDRVRDLAAASDRRAIADQYIGRIFAHAAGSDDGIWPPRAVRDQIERLQSEELERGIAVERFNMRGAHFRALYQGGEEERQFAESYREQAKKISSWPRTASLLNSIAENWEQHGVHADIEARQRKLRS